MADSTGQVMSSLPPIPPNIAEITAPLLFGVVWNWTLYGALVVQVYIYNIYFSKDKKVFKVLVYGIFLVDTFQTALSGADIWYWFCHGFGDLNKLNNTYISNYDTPMLGSFIGFSVQLFFCYRIWTLSKNRILAGFIASVSLLQCIGGFIVGVRAAIHPQFNSLRSHVDVVGFDVWLIGTAVADTMIAICLSYLLLTASAGSKRSTTVVQRIVRLTVETNSVSAGAAIISIILYFALPAKSYFICPTFFLGKLYSNALLVTFNNRVILTRSAETNTSSLGSGPANSLPRANALYSPPRGGIKITQQRHTRYDESMELESFSLSLPQEGHDKDTLSRFPESAFSQKASNPFP
ncbi:hypothetical protein M422DRAFT_785402 [Sphaerobolus stellatus SS14]|uniref:DUF6534 domain-containing protein n=1 Tax=Sphaerobolus stellatus (strain SS14) TaxID=990650 RepID=A0A0C9UK78_SPHS4|nr:hypothetical protein M422DRAFT_785402 [Sphaerobolus stellatus SS14]